MSSSDDDDGSTVIVIDNGTGMCKAGFAGDDAPRSVFPPCVGRPRNTGVQGWQHRDTYVGDEAHPKMYPMEHGVVKNWDDMEKVWHHVFYNELRIQPEKFCVLITDAPLVPKSQREKMLELLFEKFNVCGVVVAMSNVMALYASGHMTGISVDTGAGGTSVVPIYLGHPVQNAIQRLDLGGGDVTAYLQRLLCESGWSFSTSDELEEVNRIKEKVCRVSLNFHEECKKYERGEVEEKTYTLPDGQVINVGCACIQAPEALFNPSLLSSSTTKIPPVMGGCSSSATDNGVCGIHELVYRSLMHCDVDLHKDMLCNIVGSGGNTMFDGLTNRFTREMKSLVPPNMRVRPVFPPERKYSVWIGGSIYGSLVRQWITKQDYLEHGPTIVHKMSGGL